MKTCQCCKQQYDLTTKIHKINHIIPKWVYKNYIKPNGINYFKLNLECHSNISFKQYSDEYAMELWCDDCEKKSADFDNKAHDLFIKDSRDLTRESLKKRLSEISDGNEIEINYSDVLIIQKWVISLIIRDAIANGSLSSLPKGIHDAFLNGNKYNKMYLVFSTMPITEFPLNDFKYFNNFGFFKFMICGVIIFIPIQKKYKITQLTKLTPNNNKYIVSANYLNYLRNIIVKKTNDKK